MEGVVSISLKALVAPDLPDNDVQKKVAMELYDEYTQKYKTFNLYPGHTWDQVMLVAQVLKKVDPKLDPNKEDDLVKIRPNSETALKGFRGLWAKTACSIIHPPTISA